MFVFTLLIGLFMLVTGAELLVRGGGQLALALRVPALVVGLTVVAFGTSTPELAVSVTAAVADPRGTEIALANVTGSNIANIAFVLGLAALVRPLRVDRSLMSRELPVVLTLQVLYLICCLSGWISRFEGIILLSLGVLYNGWVLTEALRRRRTLGDAALLGDDLPEEGSGGWYVQVAMLLAGIVVLLLGAWLFVDGAVWVAEILGLSPRFIGLTVVALGTSAPEVATAVVSAYRGQTDLAIGNSIGSNILNISMVLGVTAIIAPIHIVDTTAFLDMGIAVGVTLLLVPIVLSGGRLGRAVGALLVTGYVAYLLLTPSDSQLVIERGSAVCTEAPPGLSAKLGDGGVVVEHIGFATGCCTAQRFGVETEQDGLRVHLSYDLVGTESCECTCPLEATYTLTGLPRGEFTLSVGDAEVTVAVP